MVRSVVIKEISKKQLEDYRDSKWDVLRESGGLYTIRRKLSKWEKLEASMRELFQDAKFEHALDPYEYWFTDLGAQVDVCGGVGDHFMIIDCTTKNEEGYRSLADKIKDTNHKKPVLERGVESVYHGRYKQVHFGICTLDIDISQQDVNDAADHGILLFDSSVLDQWRHVVDVLGPAVQYQIVETIARAKIPIRGKKGPLKYKALRILVHPAHNGGEEPRHVYLFAIDPETMLDLAVVYRLKYKDPVGYQRDLKPGKLRSINEYLSDWSNFFPNSILVAFDEEGPRKLQWEGKRGDGSGPVEDGWILIPAYHGFAEIIDGQHRLYGYVDFTKDGGFEKTLSQRKKDDRLLVVAIPDPQGSERPSLYLSINATQTKISSREIWALMGGTRPSTKMGFTSNVIRRLNERGVFANSIEIPGVTRGSRSINIANFGKGISDRHLIDNEGEEHNWNLWNSPRIGGPYPDIPDAEIVEKLNAFFLAVKECHLNDWNAGKSFLQSNNGVNVMLRVMVEVLKYHPGKRFTRDRAKDLLKPVLKKYILEFGAKELLSRTSNEVGREAVSREIIERISKQHDGFAHAYLAERKPKKAKRKAT